MPTRAGLALLLLLAAAACASPADPCAKQPWQAIVNDAVTPPDTVLLYKVCY